MIKVGVSEETPNLSHPSDLISTVRLENSSPSLMRLIKASGHTHSWVRRKETLGEIPRGSWWDTKNKKLKKYWWEAKRLFGEMPRARGRNSSLVERTREELKNSCWENKREQERGRAEEKRQQQQFLGALTCIPRLPNSIEWHRNWILAVLARISWQSVQH